LAAVGQRNDDLVGVTDHMVVRDNDTRGIDDESRSGAGDLFGSVAEAAAEFSAHWGVAQFRRQLAQHIAPGYGFGDRDVHHRRKHLFDERRQAFRRRAGTGQFGRTGRRQQQYAQDQRTTEPLPGQGYRPAERGDGWHECGVSPVLRRLFCIKWHCDAAVTSTSELFPD
jgi:hypothetical protein